MDALDKFGSLLIEELKNRPLEWLNSQLKGKDRSSSGRMLHQELCKLSSTQQDLVRDCLNIAISTGIHNLLAKLYEMHDFNEGIEIIVDNENILALTDDGIHYELYEWEAKFSRYPTSAQIDDKYEQLNEISEKRSDG